MKCICIVLLYFVINLMVSFEYIKVWNNMFYMIIFILMKKIFEKRIWLIEEKKIMFFIMIFSLSWVFLLI